MSHQGSYFKDILSLPVEISVRTTPPIVSHLEPVSFVIDTMIKEDIGAVIVVDDHTPLGIITEKDLLEWAIKSQKDPELTRARDVMSQPLITIEADHPIDEALELMRRHDIRRLAVTDNGVLIGLTTERRLLEVAHGRNMAGNYNSVKKIQPDHLYKIKVGFLSTYPPRECGIATYTKDLLDGISGLYMLKPSDVLAINDKGGHYNYMSEVVYQIDRENLESYIAAAKYVNESNIDVINLQHEFGLFGGIWGENILQFLESVKKPVITTLHTILLEPEKEAERILKGIIQHSDFIIVMARIGILILEELYETFADKIRYIPHGCPNVPFIKSETLKQSLGMEDRIILSTFGLLSRGKGIEYAIQALPPIIEEDPRILYLIIGETHPEVRKHEGEKYRRRLFDLVESLGIENNIRFVNRFLPKNELIRYLQATDIYIIPYPNREQISSGTLLYALSTGKAIISTPFLHAEEIMSEGCAIGCEFQNPESITESIRTLLRYDDIYERLEKRAYEYSRGMIWPNVAMKYVNLFYESLGM